MANTINSKPVSSKNVRLRGKRPVANEAPQKLKVLVTIVG